MAKKEFNAENVDRVRSGPGVYKLYKKRTKKPTYIGSANNLGRRLGEHAGQKFSKFEVLHTETTREARSLEKKLIRKHKPKRNVLSYA